MSEKNKAAQIMLDGNMPIIIRRGNTMIEFNHSGGIIVKSDAPVTLRPAETAKAVDAIKPAAAFSSSATEVNGKPAPNAGINMGAGEPEPMRRETYNPTFQIDPAAARRGKHPAGGGWTSSITSAP